MGSSIRERWSSSLRERWFHELASWLIIVCGCADAITASFEEYQELQVFALLCHVLLPVPILIAARVKHGSRFKILHPFSGGGAFIASEFCAYTLWTTGLVVRWTHAYTNAVSDSSSQSSNKSLSESIPIDEVQYEDMKTAINAVLRASFLRPLFQHPEVLNVLIRFSHTLGAGLFFFLCVATFQPDKGSGARRHKRSGSDPISVQSSGMMKLSASADGLLAFEQKAKKEKVTKKKEKLSIINITKNIRFLWKMQNARGSIISSMVVVLIMMYLGVLGLYFVSQDPTTKHYYVVFMFVWQIPLPVLTRIVLMLHFFSALFCHFFFGMSTISGFRIFEPFVGPKRYKILQGLAWACFANATLFFYSINMFGSDVDTVPDSSQWLAAFILSFIGSFLLLLTNCCRLLFWSEGKRFRSGVRPADLARVSLITSLMVLPNHILFIFLSPQLTSSSTALIRALSIAALMIAPVTQGIIFLLLPIFRSKSTVQFPAMQKEKKEIKTERSEKGFFDLVRRFFVLGGGVFFWVFSLSLFFVAPNTNETCLLVDLLCALSQCFYYPILAGTSTEFSLAMQLQAEQQNSSSSSPSPRSSSSSSPRSSSSSSPRSSSSSLESSSSSSPSRKSKQPKQNEHYSAPRVRRALASLHIDKHVICNGPFNLSFSLFVHTIIFRWLLPVFFSLKLFGTGNPYSYLIPIWGQDENNTDTVSWAQFSTFILACSFYCFTASVPIAHLSIRGFKGLWRNPFSGTPIFATTQVSSWIAYFVCFAIQLYLLIGDLFSRDPSHTRFFHHSDTVLTQRVVKTLITSIGNTMLETGAMFLPYALTVASVLAFDSILHNNEQDAEDGLRSKSLQKIASSLEEHEFDLLKQFRDTHKDSARLKVLCDSIIAFSEESSPAGKPSSKLKSLRERKDTLDESFDEPVHPTVLFLAITCLSVLASLLILNGEKSLQSETQRDATDLALVFIPAALGFLTCTGAIIFAHALLGPSLHDKGTYVLWMPFRGGSLFIFLQALGFGAYTTSLVQIVFCIAAVASQLNNTGDPLAVSISLIPPALLSSISPILIAISSLFFIPPQRKRRDERNSISDNAEGLICLLVLFGGWCVATFNDTFFGPAEWASATAPLVICCFCATLATPLGVISLRKSASMWAKQQEGHIDTSPFEKPKTGMPVPLVLLESLIISACLLFPVVLVYIIWWIFSSTSVPVFEVWSIIHAYGTIFLVIFLAIFFMMVIGGFFADVLAFLGTACIFMFPHVPVFVSILFPLLRPGSISAYWATFEMLISVAFPPLWIQPVLAVIDAGCLSLASRRLFCVWMCASPNLFCGNFQSESLFGNDVYAAAEHTVLFLFCLLYKLTFIGSPERRGRYSFWISTFMRHTLFWAMERYFALQVFAEPSEILNKKTRRQYMFGYHPHGVLAFTCAWIPLSSAWRRILPHSVIRFGASIMFQVPLLRDIVMAIGARVVTKEAILGALHEKNRTVSTMLVPGGQAEMIESHSSDTELIVKNHHLGFLRIAIQQQIPAVPVFCFGEHDIIDNIPLPRIQRFFLNLVGAAMPVVPYGLFGCLPFPRPKQLTVVVGKPIDPEQIQAKMPLSASPASPLRSSSSSKSTTTAPVDDKLLREVADAYFEELRRIFYLYRERAGYPKMELILNGKTR